MTMPLAVPSFTGRAASPLLSRPLLALLAVLFATSTLTGQDLELIAPTGADGPEIDLWLEDSYPDLEFGFRVSEPAYVAAFEVVPGLGATLVLPDRDSQRWRVDSGHRVTAGSYSGVLDRRGTFDRAVADRLLSARYGYGVHRPDRGYLLLVASRAPLDLWRFERLDDYRYAIGGQGGYTSFDGSARLAAERLIERILPRPGAGGWSAAYVSYSLRPHLDRFAYGYGSRFLCLGGFGHPAAGFRGYGYGHGYRGYGYSPFGAFRHGGYGFGRRAFYFPGLRSFGYGWSGPGLFFWSDPFGFGYGTGFGRGPGFGSPCGFGYRYGFGFGTHPFGRFFFPRFPRHPDGRQPSEPGGRTAVRLPARIHPQPRIPVPDRETLDEQATAATRALRRGPVPVPGVPIGVQRIRSDENRPDDGAAGPGGAGRAGLPRAVTPLPRSPTPEARREPRRVEPRTPAAVERRLAPRTRPITPERLRSSAPRRPGSTRPSARVGSPGDPRRPTATRPARVRPWRATPIRTPSSFRTPTIRRLTPAAGSPNRARFGNRLRVPSSRVRRPPSTSIGTRRPARASSRPAKKPRKG